MALHHRRFARPSRGAESRMTPAERWALWDYYILGLTQQQAADKRGVKLWRVRKLTQRKDAWMVPCAMREARILGGLTRWHRG